MNTKIILLLTCTLAASNSSYGMVKVGKAKLERYCGKGSKKLAKESFVFAAMVTPLTQPACFVSNRTYKTHLCTYRKKGYTQSKLDRDLNLISDTFEGLLEVYRKHGKTIADLARDKAQVVKTDRFNEFKKGLDMDSGMDYLERVLVSRVAKPKKVEKQG